MTLAISMSEICSHDKIIYDEERGEYICTETGEVLEERAFYQKPGILQDKEERKVSQKNKTLQEIEVRRKEKRLSTRERYLKYAVLELKRLTSVLNLPSSVQEQALIIYKKAVVKGLLHGRKMEELVTASVYIACRTLRVTRTLDEIANYSKVDKRRIIKLGGLIANSLNIKPHPVDPKDLVVKFADELKLENEIVKEALEIIEKAKRTGLLFGKTPANIAASAIYLSCRQHKVKVSARKIALVADVAVSSIMHTYSKIAKMI